MKSCLSFDFLTPNVDQQHTARLWIQSVLQIQLPDSDNLYTSLRDGVFLCKLMNDLIPNSIPFIYYENNMDAWTKNIQQFLIASEQNGGLDTFQLFDINDLLYGHDMIAVARTLSFLHDQITEKNQLDDLLLLQGQQQQLQRQRSASLNHQQQYHHHHHYNQPYRTHEQNNTCRRMKRRYTVPFREQEGCLTTKISDNRSYLGVLHDIGENEEKAGISPSSSTSLLLTSNSGIKEKAEHEQQQQQQLLLQHRISSSTNNTDELPLPWENNHVQEYDDDDDDDDDEHIIPETPSCPDRHSPAIDSTSSGDSGYGTTTTTTTTMMTKKKNSLRGAIHLTSLFNPPPSPPFQEHDEEIEDEDNLPMIKTGRASTVGRHERLSSIDFYNNDYPDHEKNSNNDSYSNEDKKSMMSKTTGRSSATSRLARLSSNLSFRKKLPNRQKIPFHMRYQEWTDLKLRKDQAKRRPSLNSNTIISVSTTATTCTPAPSSYSLEQENHTVHTTIIQPDEMLIASTSTVTPQQPQREQYTRIESSASSPVYNPDNFTGEQEMVRQRRVSKMKKLSIESWGDPSHSQQQEIKTSVAVPRRKSTGTLEFGQSTINKTAASTTTTTPGDTGERLEMRHPDGTIVARYKLGNTIGKGQFGTVHRALNLNTGQMVAIKRIKLDDNKIHNMDEVMQEAQILRTLSHPNIVECEGFIQSPGCMNIVLEYVENGSLASTLRAFGSFPEDLVARYCLRILKGLAYLHQERVVHCDLKAANILTTKNGNVKLSDFGVSVNLKLKESLTGSIAGTPNWMAPEVIELQGASTKSDIWSLGCTVIELFTGKPPYADLIPMTTLFKIVEDDCPPLPEDGPKDFKDFLRQCFHKTPKERPTANELLRHPWIQRHQHASAAISNIELPLRNSGVVLPHQQQGPVLDSISSYHRPVSTLYPDDYQYHGDFHHVHETGHKRTTSSGGEQHHDLLLPTVQPPTSILVNKLHERQEKMNPSSMITRDHCFIKGSFPKGAIRCKVCQLPIRRNALVCEECGFFCHDKCKPAAGTCRSTLTDNASIRSGSESSCSSSVIEPTNSNTKAPRPTSSMSSQLRERTRKLSKVLTNHRRPHSTRSHDTLRFIREDDGEGLSHSSSPPQPTDKNNTSSIYTHDTPAEFLEEGTIIRNSTSASYAETPHFNKGRRTTRRSSSPSSEDCIIS